LLTILLTVVNKDIGVWGEISLISPGPYPDIINLEVAWKWS
jgi:hypothetical protein